MSFRKRWSLYIWQRLLLGLMLMAALLPLYAPWLNSNFAALQPGHDHLYVGKASHRHHHNSPLHDLLGGQASADDGQVANLPNLDAAGRTAVLFTVPLLLLALLASLSRFSLFEAPQFGFTLFTLAPPTAPPRLSLTSLINQIFA